MNAPAENPLLESDPRYDARREIRAPRGSQRSCKSWLTEAAFRMIQNCGARLEVVRQDPRSAEATGKRRVAADPVG
jgi:urocanate hydratase